MEKALTVVLGDETILPEICGPNDGNLRVFEELLGVRVIPRGNELLLETGDDEVERTFRSLLQQVEDHVRLGQLPGPDLIRSLHRAITGGEAGRAELFKSTAVAIPGGYRKVYPRTINQARYLDDIARRELVFGIGPAGTGKTYLAVAQALSQVCGQGRRKLVVTRPVVEAGESLGFLPGDLGQKLQPYLRPLYDAIEALVPPETARPARGSRSHRGRAARLHARAHPLQRLHHPRRGAEHDPRADEDVPHPHRRELPHGGDGRHHPDRPAAAVRLGAPARHVDPAARSGRSASSGSRSRTSCATRWCGASSTPTRPRMKSSLAEAVSPPRGA